jgi:hypothetical protein
MYLAEEKGERAYGHGELPNLVVPDVQVTQRGALGEAGGK